MCGICGFFENGSKPEELIVRKMTAKLSHRGPDAVDYYIDKNVAFGFTRLSIIDLENGMQPISNEDGSIILICNGEIFNYVEIRNSLLLKGHRFKTKSDVEVILHLYEENGPNFVNLLNGQFAFVIYDSRKELLFCARDQVGIAPFFYTIVDKVFIFGSEIKAILEYPTVKKNVDLQGLDQIFTFPGLVSPRTLFKDIYSLENGHYLLVQQGSLKNIEYWDLKYPKVNEINYLDDENYYIDTLDKLLTKAINYRLQADVPVGFYISGGLDSSIIAAKINKLSCNPQHSFSMDFEDKNISESKYQRMMANYVGSSHHELCFHFSDIATRLTKAVYHSECALKETYNTASLALSEYVNNQKIKVVLTGEGADELFGGYVGYRFDKLRQQQLKQNSPVQLYENEVRKKLWGNETFFYEKDYASFKKTKQELYSENVCQTLNDYEYFSCLINKERIENVDIFHQRSYIDFKLRMSDHLLSDHGDRMAYANSVEARYPFLDPELIEFSRLIPPSLKLKDFTEKYILKKIAMPIVPQEIINRPKFAFVAPGSPDLIKQNIGFIHDILSREKIEKQGYFNPNTITNLKQKYHQSGFKLNLPFENDYLVTVITFGIFLEQFGMPNL
jgi:asparagine synthase (glutamine-hydrolysing)